MQTEIQKWKLMDAYYDKVSDRILLDFLVVDSEIDNGETEVMPQPYTKQNLKKWEKQIGEIFKAKVACHEKGMDVILDDRKEVFIFR
jgi:hypothetical protein